YFFRSAGLSLTVAVPRRLRYWEALGLANNSCTRALRARWTFVLLERALKNHTLPASSTSWTVIGCTSSGNAPVDVPKRHTRADLARSRIFSMAAVAERFSGEES